MSTFLFLPISTSHSTTRRDAEQRLIVKTLEAAVAWGPSRCGQVRTTRRKKTKQNRKTALEGDRSGVLGPVFGTRSNTALHLP